MNRSLNSFIEGETVNLCHISDHPEVIHQWYQWFNNSEKTKFNRHGSIPNTPNKQLQYINKIDNDPSHLAVLITSKNNHELIGTASLSSINHINRECEISMMIGEKIKDNDSIFYGLETKALLTQHAFDILGMERISSGQVTDLIAWQKWQILFGYQIEGIMRNKIRKGRDTHDVYISSCILEDYLKIIKQQNGSLWPGKSELLNKLRNIPKETLIDKLNNWLPKEQQKYWNEVHKSEG